MDGTPLKKQCEQRLGALKVERASWESHWRDIATVLLPRASRFLTTDRNRGDRKHQSILDATATSALNVMASGLMAGATSPGRPWFDLMVPDPTLSGSTAVERWVDAVVEQMRDEIARTNIYRALPSTYTELGGFGTACTFIRPLRGRGRGLVHCYPLTVGEYWLGQSDLNMVDTMYREFDMTVAQVVQQFGLDAVSTGVRRRYERGERDSWVTIVHAIEPRMQRDPMRGDSANMPWRSVYLERGGDGNEVLAESGYELFPVVAPRWSTVGGNTYGDGPAMVTLGAIEQLQHQQWRKGQAIDYQTSPPKAAPASMEGREISMLPGSTTFGLAPGEKVESLVRAELRIDHLQLDMQEVRGRIREGFYSDLFLMLASSDRRQMTAAEVAERHEEKLLMLGPVLENLHDELLRPLIDLVFHEMVASGKVPPPPPELVGMDLQVEFTSMLAQAQKAIGVNTQDRFMTTVMALKDAKPEILDRIDSDALLDSYAKMLNVPAKILVPVEEAEAIRVARNKAYAAKEQAAMLQAQSQTTRNLAQSPIGGPQQNALDALQMVAGA